MFPHSTAAPTLQPRLTAALLIAALVLLFPGPTRGDGWTVTGYILDEYVASEYDPEVTTLTYTSPPPTVYALNHASTDVVIAASWHRTASYSGPGTAVAQIDAYVEVQGAIDGTPDATLIYGSAASVTAPNHSLIVSDSGTSQIASYFSSQSASWVYTGVTSVTANGALSAESNGKGGYAYATYTTDFVLSVQTGDPG